MLHTLFSVYPALILVCVTKSLTSACSVIFIVSTFWNIWMNNRPTHERVFFRAGPSLFLLSQKHTVCVSFCSSVCSESTAGLLVGMAACFALTPRWCLSDFLCYLKTSEKPIRLVWLATSLINVPQVFGLATLSLLQRARWKLSPILALFLLLQRGEQEERGVCQPVKTHQVYIVLTLFL
jgi:hypothetical protein